MRKQPLTAGRQLVTIRCVLHGLYTCSTLLLNRVTASGISRFTHASKKWQEFFKGSNVSSICLDISLGGKMRIKNFDPGRFRMIFISFLFDATCLCNFWLATFLPCKTFIWIHLFMIRSMPICIRKWIAYKPNFLNALRMVFKGWNIRLSERFVMVSFSIPWALPKLLKIWKFKTITDLTSNNVTGLR